MVETKPKSTKGPRKVMVVDDDMFCSQLVKMMLEQIGQVVDLASNGRESVGLYQKNCKGYKVIFMDIHMPEVDGF